MASSPIRLVTVLGPTASGKTRLGVQLARALDGEIVSADSRQVYRGLDIGAGKDLDEYTIEGLAIPHHLIDVADLEEEFSLFEFQQRCYRTLEAIASRRKVPVLVGGSGLYLEAVLLGYPLAEVGEDPALRRELAGLDDEALRERLRSLQGPLHNTTDLASRERTVRAIEIASHPGGVPPRPAIDSLVLGLRWEPAALRERIRLRLEERLAHGLIEEVEGLLARGASPERLQALGLEYRHVADLLTGTTPDRAAMTEGLYRAICQFARRQRSFFRRMERRGIDIRWIEGADGERALELARTFLQPPKAG